MALFKEFKAFAMRGNVIDLAIGVIIGAAFGKIVSSLVADLITPVLGMILGKVEFKSLFIALDGNSYPTLEAARAATAPILTYGGFLQAVIDFLIVAFVLFVVVRQINRMKTKPQGPPPAATTKECPECASTIPLKARRCAYCTTPVG